MNYDRVLKTLYKRTPDPMLASRILETIAYKTIAGATMAPLYVYRPVLNAKALLKHFKRQGDLQLCKAKDLHVTVAFSKEPVNWKDFTPCTATLTISNTKHRKLLKLGDYVVQGLKSQRLQTRFQYYIDGGATWDFPSYIPHISIIDDDHNTVDIKDLKPYKGDIILGAERFEPIKPKDGKVNANVHQSWFKQYYAAIAAFKIKATTHDGDKYFDLNMRDYAVKKSRETLIHLDPKLFLKLADVGFSQSKQDAVNQYGIDGKFTDVPILTFDNDGKGKAVIVGHEGRHRARFLISKNIHSMPVRFSSREGGLGKAIRWGACSDPDSYDYIKDFPTKLYSQDGSFSIPFPQSDIYSAIAAAKVKPYKAGDLVHYMGRLHEVHTAVKQHNTGSYNYKTSDTKTHQFTSINHDWINHDFSQRKKKSIAKEHDFEENKHPRKNDGEFAPKNSGESTLKANHRRATDTDENKKRVDAEHGGELPEHIKKLGIPPAWTHVSYNIDPDGSLLVTGKDAKGRSQAIYSLKHSAEAAAAKFARVKELDKKYKAIFKQNEEARKSDNKHTRNAADCAFLIMKMGIRPGSDSDTGAEKKAYGATNMLGKHVVVDDKGKVRLQFTGKKGVSIDLPVEDKEVSKMLMERKKNAGDDGKLFDSLNEDKLLEHVHSFDGGGFKTKDFRTRLASVTAAELIAKTDPPKNEKEYKKKVNDIGDAVAKKLANTRTIALQSYVNPAVFATWQTQLGNKHE